MIPLSPLGYNTVKYMSAMAKTPNPVPMPGSNQPLRALTLTLSCTVQMQNKQKLSKYNQLICITTIS